MSKNLFVMVDVETTGPIPGKYSMFWFGAVVVEPGLNRYFDGKLRPLENAIYEGGPENNIGLKLANLTHTEVEQWPNPLDTMRSFAYWLNSLQANRLTLVSDNNGFDAMFINWYFHTFLERSPFGHSSVNLGSLYKGLVHNMFKNFKHLRQTKHTHNPVDDARGNAEAMLHMMTTGGIIC